MYVCGPTVYDDPHIGHARSAYIFDVIRRYLVYKGYKVKFVKNVTDVDDKIIDKAKKEYSNQDLNAATQKISEYYLNAYHDAMNSLGIFKPDVEPKATEYVTKNNPAIQNFINLLIEHGMAYVSDGDVYFDIRKAKDYGKLSRQSLEKMETGARIHPGEKKNDPLDFALWKKAKEGEPSWDSPWGKGRPGWHIECSVMSSDILGDEFDIHGGGLDLIFPHHENEIAQSEGAGKKFARYWIHHGLLTINGQKMAKSLGNFITVKDFLSRYDADVLKFFFLQAHYSQPVDFTWEKIAEKQKALKRVITVLESIKHIEAGKEFIVKTDLKQKISQKELMEAVEQAHRDFKKAMDDDFNTPNAVAVLFEIVRSCDKILYDVGYTDDYLPVLIKAKQAIEEFGNIFGLSFKVIPLSKREEDIKRLIDIRLSLKNQKLFAEADKIRKELEEEGIILEDTKDGKTIWRSK